MSYTHTKTVKYQKIEYKMDGVSRAVLLPLDAPESVLSAYLKKITQANTQPAAPAPESLEAAVATA
jgi:hypothetical protein